MKLDNEQKTQVVQIIKKELAELFFALYRKRGVWQGVMESNFNEWSVTSSKGLLEIKNKIKQYIQES